MLIGFGGFESTEIYLAILSSNNSISNKIMKVINHVPYLYTEGNS